jgi:hypothetical protein
MIDGVISIGACVDQEMMESISVRPTKSEIYSFSSRGPSEDGKASPKSPNPLSL